MSGFNDIRALNANLDKILYEHRYDVPKRFICLTMLGTAFGGFLYYTFNYVATNLLRTQ